MKLLLIALQAVAGPALDDPRLHAVPRQCALGEDGEVTVCARRADPYRIPRLPDRYAESAPPKAETTVLGNAKVGVEVEQGSVGGVSSNRAMARLKIPF